MREPLTFLRRLEVLRDNAATDEVRQTINTVIATYRVDNPEIRKQELEDPAQRIHELVLMSTRRRMGFTPGLTTLMEAASCCGQAAVVYWAFRYIIEDRESDDQGLREQLQEICGHEF